MNLSFRIAFLFATTIVSGSAFPAEETNFSGHWLDCESYQGATVCSGYVLEQKGPRVCGAESSFATSRQYEGYLKGEAKKGLFIATSGCGAGAGIDCPKFTAVKNRGLLLCGRSLYETGGRNISCEEASRKKTLRPYKKVSAKEYERNLSKPDWSVCSNAL